VPPSTATITTGYAPEALRDQRFPRQAQGTRQARLDASNAACDRAMQGCQPGSLMEVDAGGIFGESSFKDTDGAQKMKEAAEARLASGEPMADPSKVPTEFTMAKIKDICTYATTVSGGDATVLHGVAATAASVKVVADGGAKALKRSRDRQRHQVGDAAAKKARADDAAAADAAQKMRISTEKTQFEMTDFR
jgi:hypothetical protein